MTLDCVVFNKNELYLPISLIGKLSYYYGLLGKTKIILEDLYLNLKQCISILMKKYTIWSQNLVLLLLKKRTLLSKILAVSVDKSKRVSWASQLS